MWNIDPIQMQQYYETLVTLRGGHIQKGRVKEGNYELEYSWYTLYTRMNTKISNWLKPP
jgi:hypothetical protein